MEKLEHAVTSGSLPDDAKVGLKLSKPPQTRSCSHTGRGTISCTGRLF